MKKNEDGQKNRLAGEKSPYLQQHAGNPVDWFPWGQEAFERARIEEKPIFLSIGYSTCHWCHVMERESFEDPEVAALMNDAFISIKVDREERPDIDAQYMAVCQMLTQGGGWPLTIIMTPDKKPFFAGTYFPRETLYGRIGMLDLVPQIKHFWEKDRARAIDAANHIADALQQTTATLAGSMPGEKELHRAFSELSQKFDRLHGGFGMAPKFPTPHNLSFLLRYWNRTGNISALSMVEKTLKLMRSGGIFDQVGFGFHRYSTDREWLLPHFEKMLYDQALIAIACLETFQATGNEEYAKTAKEIFTYCLRDMRSPEGAFYSAEDADSDGVEGKFYLWEYDEIRSALTADEAELFSVAFNINKNGNVNDPHGGIDPKLNIPHRGNAPPGLAAEKGSTIGPTDETLGSIRERLFLHREKRIHPLKDRKVLVDWNGLMIAALALGGRILGKEEYRQAAIETADFILRKMRTGEGGLLHRYLEGESVIPGTLNDYAFLVNGLIELYETTFDVSWLRSAIELNNYIISHFADNGGGGFYLTADNAEKLLARQKEIYDGALPSGNSMEALNLLRLGRITGNPELDHLASRTIQAFSSEILTQPSAYTQMLAALDFSIGPSREIVISGTTHTIDTKEMLGVLNRSFIPNKVVVFVPANTASPEIKEISPYTEGQTAVNGKATAYVCSNFRCSLPTTDPGRMLQLIIASPVI